MALFDLPLSQLETFRSSMVEPEDFDEFWLKTIGESLISQGTPRISRLETSLTGVQVYDLAFAGFEGQTIKGWFITPGDFDHTTDRIPCVVQYQGYGGGRGYPHEWLLWPNTGAAILVMDTRGQGSSWSRGDTPDIEAPGSNPQHPGFMTRGILDPETYYYRRVYIDALMALRTASVLPGIDPDRIILAGGSQGGGITIAVNGLLGIMAAAASTGDEIFKVMCDNFPQPLGALIDVPFLCDIRRATEITNAHPYQEIAAWCRIHREETEMAFATLRYFDGVAMAARSRTRALFSVGLMDDICPPSTVYAAYNAWAGHASIEVYPYNGHEGGGECQAQTRMAFVAELLD